MNGGSQDTEEDSPGRAGLLVRECRHAAGLTQRQLASAAGVSIGVVRDLEQGLTAHLRARSADALIRALNLDARRGRELMLALRAKTAGPAAPADQSAELQLRVLGPLTVRVNGTFAELGPPARRAILALLALAPAELVLRDTLIDALWGPSPPATAVNTIQAHIGRLRRLLDPGRARRDPSGRLVSAGTGYRLRVTSAQLDLLAFRELVGRARSAQDASGACDLYEQALALWRSDPAAGLDIVAGHPAVAALSRELAAVVTGYGELACGAGWHERALPCLMRLTQGDPLNEKAHALVMIALAGSGQQAAALDVYEKLRLRLDDQLGVQPCAELAEAHQRVLRQQIPGAGDVSGPAAPAHLQAVPVTPRQLPAAAPHFVGRVSQLEALDAMLQPGGEARGTAVISAIGGIAGVGKTALALWWAHRVAAEFPDGQLYADLRGFGPGGPPRPAGTVILDFLEALGIPAARAPAGAQAQAGLYRSVMAGRRMLVLLDNARDSEQAAPLLPGGPGCRTLVTSRGPLAGLVAAGAHSVPVGVLSPADARELLGLRLGAARAAAEPVAMEQIVALTGRLPLALSIVAARTAADPDGRLEALAAELRDVHGRLDALAGGEVSADVRAAFSWSCDRLSAPAGRLLRLLGLHPGPEVSVAAAASLAGIGRPRARHALAELTAAGLLTESSPGRHACHDLVRSYAAELSLAGDGDSARQTATARMLSHYLHSARNARLRLLPGSKAPDAGPLEPGVQAEKPGDYDQAMAWFTAERPVLLSALSQAHGPRFDFHAQQLPLMMSIYLEISGRWQDLIDIMRISMAAAQRSGDPHMPGWAHYFIGDASRRLDRTGEGAAHLEDALRLFRQAGDHRGQGRTQCAMAEMLIGQLRYDQALDHARAAVAAYRLDGDKNGQALTLDTLGLILSRLGDHDQAADCCQEASSLSRETGHRVLAASSQETLSQIYRNRGQYARAIDCGQQAVSQFREIGHQWGEAGALSNLGDTYLAAGDAAGARRSWRRALALHEGLTHPRADRIHAKLRQLDLDAESARA